MPSVYFTLQDKTIFTAEGITILEAARTAGIIIESPCNGLETCGKCKVKLDQASIPNIQSAGAHHLSAAETEQGLVLACASKIKGDITVEAASQESISLKIVSQGFGFSYKLDSYIKKIQEPVNGHYEIYAGDQLLGTEPDGGKKSYGAVIDIGTTTLVAALVDLVSGHELGTISSLNPQAVYAQDVLSRIKMASEVSGLATLNRILVDEINMMIRELAKKNAIHTQQIYELLTCGNTCMLHLLAGISPYSLGKYPYQPEFSGHQYLQAKDLGLDISPFGIVYTPPVVSAFVGADISAGILASQMYKEKGNVLFVDIGTNGEMVLACNGQLSATSTAAGPAFEGMNISDGMRAASGAIEYFDIDAQGKITIRTIDNQDPIGICGSGIMDVVGELAAHGLLTSNGKLVSPEQVKPAALQQRLVRLAGKPAFQVAPDVYLTQKDIRQVQLAKGAIRAGIEFLLSSRELEAADVDRVLIAGSFGYHLQAQSLLNLGLLPQAFAGKIEFIGNTSKSGGDIFLLNQHYRTAMAQKVKDIQVIELANYGNFDKVFMQSLGF